MTSSTISSLYPNLSSLLLAIRDRPCMFLNSKSVLALSTFINGIIFAESFHEIEASKQFCDFDFLSFEEWVSESFNPQSLTLNSFGLAVHLSGSTDKGFELWFSWYDRFCHSAKVSQQVPTR